VRPSNGARFAICTLTAALTACSFIAPRSAPAPTLSPTLSQQELDVNSASSMVLVVDEIPPGWAAEDHHRSAGELSDTKRIQACLGATAPARFTADVDGQDFTKGELQISSTVTITPTLKEARRDLRVYTGARFRPCLIGIARADAGSDLASISVHRISVDRYGDASFAYRLAATLQDKSHRSTSYNDVYFFVAGRAQVALSLVNTGRPFPASIARTLVRRLGKKIRTV